jgi:excisionase family DNA binding protein
MNDGNLKKYFTISQAAKYLGVSKDTIRRWEKAGKISSTIDPTGVHLFTKENLRSLPSDPRLTAPHAPQLLSSPLSLTDAASAAGVSKSTLLRWEKAGIIKGTRTAGGARRFHPADIQHLLETRATYQRVLSPPKDSTNIPVDQTPQQENTMPALNKNEVPVVNKNEIPAFSKIEVPLPLEEESTPKAAYEINQKENTVSVSPISDTVIVPDEQSVRKSKHLSRPLMIVGVLLLAIAGAGFLAVQIAGLRSGAQRSVAPRAAEQTGNAAGTISQASSLKTSVSGTGTAGPTGSTGMQGAIGITGPTGGTGFFGLIGIQGPTGYSGEVGVIGPSGTTGPTGSAGTTGTMGGTGNQGATGPTGPTGMNGPTGETGATGIAGAQGPSGIVIFNEANNVLFPYPVVNKSVALGSTNFTTDPETTATTSALIFLNGNNGNASISGLLTLRGGDSVIETETMSKLTIGSSTTGPIQISPKGTTGIYIDEVGNVGIGTTPTYALDVKVSGTGVIARFNSDNATGCSLDTDGTISCTSDERLKKDVETIHNGLDAILTLRPVWFDWVNSSSIHKSIGFLAQEVEKILPSLVTTDTQTGYKQLNTIGVIPMLVSAIQQLAANQETLKNQVILSPLVQFDEVKTDILSPLSDESQGIKMELNEAQTFNIYNKEDEIKPVASFDANGNATVAGSISASSVIGNLGHLDNLEVNADATVTGTLFADRIVMTFGDLNEKIDSLSDSISSIDNQQFSNNTQSTESSPSSILATLGATLSGETMENVTINKNILLTESLTSFGDTFLGHTTIGGSLLVDGAIHVDENGIQTYGSTLYIQQGKLAALDIMNGTLVINPSGNVILNGNLALNGNLQVTGNIVTSVLSPIDQNITLNLSKPSQTASISASPSSQLASEFGKLLIQGNGGYTVAGIDASGNATFSGQLSMAELFTYKLRLPTTTNESTLSGTLQPSIGSAILPAGETSTTVLNGTISEQSIVFITPTSPISSTLYVIDKYPGEFIVGTVEPQIDDVTFNWWVIN